MLDENLPTFSIRPASSENPLSNTIYLRENGNEPVPEYTLRRPDPKLPASKNCYAIALYDSYNPDVLYAEVLVQPEWTQPTLSAAEVRAQNGISPPPVPIVPEKFTIQLYNPDQQVVVRQIASTWNTSAYWEFEMPQNSFRVPSAAGIDRMANDPAAQDVTPKIGFKWKKDGKLSKDISCYLAGKTIDGKKNKEPDITVAMFKAKGDLTVYAPNMHRVDVEDNKGLEVVLILGAAVIKDIFFNANREMFNIGSPTVTAPGARRKNSGPVISGGAAPLMTGAVGAAALSNRPHPVPASQIPPKQQSKPQRVPQSYAQSTIPPSGPPAANPRTQWEIDAETERLKKLVAKEEKEREKAEREEQKRIKKMLEAEEKERKKREAEVAKETERLKKLYGVPAQQNFPPQNQQPQFQQPQQFQPPPPQMPPRPQQQNQRPNEFPQYQSAPHSVPPPVQRPVSVGGMPGGPTNCPTVNGWWNGPSAPVPASHNLPGQVGGSYIQAPVQSTGFLGLGGGKKVQKKRSVFF